jgi:uncharacterized membrane protein
MRRRDDRGAVLVMVAILATVLILVASMAVDLGVQRVARRDMQALSDVVALDMARQLDGTKTAQQLGVGQVGSAWDRALGQSVARNGDTVGDAPTVTSQVGHLDGSGQFVPAVPTDKPTAVEVTTSTSVHFTFSPGGGSVSRSAVAAAGAVACFKIGSLALRSATLDPSVLDELLGDALNTGTLPYADLAGAEVSLGDLAAELGLATPAELAGADVEVGELLEAVTAALQGTDGDTPEVGILRSIRSQLGTPGGRVVSISDIVSIGEDVSSTVKVDVLDLVAGAAFAATAGTPLRAPSLQVAIPHVSVTDASVTIDPATSQVGCGAAGHATAQGPGVQLHVAGSYNTVVPGLGRVFGPVGLTVDLATGSAALSAIQCTGGTATSITVDVTNTSAASTELNLDFSVRRFGQPTSRVRAGTQATAQTPQGPVVLPLPSSYDVPATVSAGTTTLAHLAPGDLVVTPAGSTLNRGNLLDTVVNPLVDDVNVAVARLSSQLGMNVAGVDLRAVRTPSCNIPALRG